MKKILIVDDAIFMLKVTSGMLCHKYKTICASSGTEAIELFEKEQPDLILLDFIMPEMNGFDLLDLLQKKFKIQIPVMIMTSDENEENESQFLNSGAIDYIRKPFSADLLLRRVDSIIRNMDRIQGLKTEAAIDSMTGLLNKGKTHEVLAEVCSRAMGTLMMIDLDSFKLINDIYGHSMGDKMLISFAGILKRIVRSSDIAGRIGGDEFLIFCQEVREEEIIALKTRQINELLIEAAHIILGKDMTIPLGASIGAVLVPDEGMDFQELYKKADKALYEVKQSGKHGYAIYKKDTSGSIEEVQLNQTTLENAQMILSERNWEKGAYDPGFEHFQSIYRFLLRSVDTHHLVVEFGLFTLTKTCDEGESEETGAPDPIEEFGNILKASLRRSDAFTKNGNNQYMVLISGVEHLNDGPILERLKNNWENSGLSDKIHVSFEATTIRSKDEIE